MNRKEELEILISSITKSIALKYDDLDFKNLDEILGNYPEIKEKEKQLERCIDEYNSLNR